jgi:hypothetical protein
MIMNKFVLKKFKLYLVLKGQSKENYSLAYVIFFYRDIIIYVKI